MREKLLILLKTEKLTSSRLAELLGIQPSNISHILSGRNKKPNFDFVQRILRRFPRINPDWLMLDSEQMYRDESAPVGHPLANELTTDNLSTEATIFSSSEPTEDINDDIQPSQNSHIPANTTMAEKISHSHKAIKRVIILYADHTFESYEG